MRAASPDEAAALARTPVQLMTFDVLRAAGHDVITLPWSARRELLDGAGIGGSGDDGSSATASAIQVPPAHDDGDALLAATERNTGAVADLTAAQGRDRENINALADAVRQLVTRGNGNGTRGGN